MSLFEPKLTLNEPFGVQPVCFERVAKRLTRNKRGINNLTTRKDHKRLNLGSSWITFSDLSPLESVKDHEHVQGIRDTRDLKALDL